VGVGVENYVTGHVLEAALPFCNVEVGVAEPGVTVGFGAAPDGF
jgi:hypothetical protein